MNLKIKLKKGDDVIILSGKDKGKTGKISLLKYKFNKAVVSGINKVKKHKKPDNNQAGGIIEKEMPIHISNLAFYDPSLKKTTIDSMLLFSGLIKLTSFFSFLPVMSQLRSISG